MESPYLEETVVTIKRSYNPKYGDNRICKCGHPYYRHFDTYEEMEPVGCKYCDCYTFEEASDEIIKCKHKNVQEFCSICQYEDIPNG